MIITKGAVYLRQPFYIALILKLKLISVKTK